MQQNVSRTVGSVFPHKKHAYMAKVLQVFLVAFILFVLTAAYLFLPEVYPFGVIRPSETCDVASIPNNTNMQLTKQYKIPIYPVTEETFTVLMLTSGKRMDLLRKSLRHFNTVPRIHKIVLCWNREDAVPPADLGDGLAVPMVTKIMKTHTLRMRFDAAELIETQGKFNIYPANLIRCPNVGLLMAHRLRLWPNSKAMLAQRIMFAGYNPAPPFLLSHQKKI